MRIERGDRGYMSLYRLLPEDVLKPALVMLERNGHFRRSTNSMAHSLTGFFV
jgi:hypothetical protein